MRILFVLKHPGSTRNFESTLRGLAERGHSLHLAFESLDGGSASGIVERLCVDFRTVSAGRLPKAPKDERQTVARWLRRGIDYLRYLEPRYADAPVLRARAEHGAPAALRALVRSPLARSPQSLAVLSSALRMIERAVPAPQVLDEFIRAQEPDVVLVTPLVGLGSPQADYVRSAQKLGVPAGLLVHSWDNLTNKGLIRDAPDLVAVWNEVQATEAVELHGVPRERVAVTGAAAFDHWFDRVPSRTRAELCAEIGLRPDAPILVYLCSSPFVAPDEVSFVRRWIAGVRAAGGLLADAGVLVRPHPQNAAQWASDPLRGFEQVTVWPPAGADPVDEAARADYYDSLHHAAAVVGVNTTALIEASIIGRPVLTLLAEEFAGTQRGTLHFHYLVEVAGGMLVAASTMEEHAAQLARAIELGVEDGRDRRFVEAFVRPYGIDRPATPELVAAVERLAGVRPTPARPTFAGRAAVHVLELLARSRRASRRTAKAPRRAGPQRAERRTAVIDPISEARDAVRRVVSDDGPIVAGPFLGEVGYELLYWIPFLRWVTRRHPGVSRRLVAVSRGGTESWYAGLSDRYVDLYDHIAPDELRAHVGGVEHETGGYRKQYAVTSLDRRLLDEVAERLSSSSYQVLHPATMFTAYRALAKQGALHRKDAIFEFAPLTAPPLGDLEAHLPERYVAARFYFSAAFPDVPENRELVVSTLAGIGASTPVVLATPGRQFDDHRDLDIADSPWLYRIDHLMTPSSNLALQTAVIAHASAFVGTYGGLSYLGPLVGVPTIAFYSDPSRFRPQHLETAQRVFRAPAYGHFLALDVAHAPLLRRVLGDDLVVRRDR